MVQPGKSDEDAVLEEERRQRIREAMAQAVKRAKEVLAFARKLKLGSTTLEDDMPAIHQVVECLAVGLVGVAVDTDANPHTVLQSMRWEEFSALFPEVCDRMLAHIPDIDKKLPTAGDRQAQKEAYFGMAHGALAEALLEQTTGMTLRDSSPDNRGR